MKHSIYNYNQMRPCCTYTNWTTHVIWHALKRHISRWLLTCIVQIKCEDITKKNILVIPGFDYRILKSCFQTADLQGLGSKFQILVQNSWNDFRLWSHTWILKAIFIADQCCNSYLHSLVAKRPLRYLESIPSTSIVEHAIQYTCKLVQGWF